MTGKGTEHSPFRATWGSTEQLLDRELRALHARDVVVMVNVTEADIRIDGRLRSNARPATPQAAIAFTTPKDPMLFACGRFRTWQDNIRAIALGLEALRKIDRYGIVQSDEQYRGWKALNAGGYPDWAQTLAAYSGWATEDVIANPDAAYRQAVKNAHPDYGGTAEAFHHVQRAKAGYTSSPWPEDTSP